MNELSISKEKICTADNPAPPTNSKYYGILPRWDRTWEHPDAVGKCIDDDHDDWRYDCPHCKCIMIYEGPDA